MKTINKLIDNRFFFIRKKSNNDCFYDYKELPMIEINNHIKRNKKDLGFWFNQLKDGVDNTHSAEMFDIPCFTWIDIDFHSQEAKTEFLLDINKKYKNVDDFFDELKKDDKIFMIGRSQGGGIRIVAVYDFLYDYELGTDEYEYENYFNDKQKEIYQEITNDFIRYICKYGLRKDSKYMDECSTKISQPSFGLRNDKYFYFNPYCKCINYIFNLESLSKIENREMTSQDIINYSMKNSDLTREIFMNPFSGLENIFSTHNVKLISIVRWCDDDARMKWFQMYKRFYTGKSFLKFLVNYDTFVKYLDGCKTLKTPSSLYWFLKNELK